MSDLGNFYNFIEGNRNSDSVLRKKKIKEKIEREKRGNIEPELKEISFDGLCDALNEEFNKYKSQISSPRRRTQQQSTPKVSRENRNNNQETLLEQSLHFLQKNNSTDPANQIPDLYHSDHIPESLIDRSIDILSNPTQIPSIERNVNSFAHNSIERYKESQKYNKKLDSFVEEVSEIEKLKKEVENLKTLLYNTMREVNVQGGGGEVRIEFMDDVDRESAKVNGNLLMYDDTTGGWIGTEGGVVGCATCIIGNPDIEVANIHASELIRIGHTKSDDSTLGYDSTHYFSDSTGEGIRLDPNGSAILTGIVTAGGFVGDGSGLDGIVSIAGTTNTLLSIDPGSLVDGTDYKLVYSSSIGGFIVTSV